MSLDVFSSKQVEINCISLNADAANITGSVSITGNIAVDNATVNGNLTVANNASVGNLDVNGFLYFDTISDYTALSHIKDTIAHSLETKMFNAVKDYVIDESYTVGDIVKLTLGIGVPIVQVANLHFICINDTSNNPTFTSPNWTYIGVIFDTTQAYPATITKVIHNGFFYNATIALAPGVFNPANWTKTGLANSNINENTIFNQTIDSSGCDITFGKNSKDHTGMLKLVAKNTAASEIQSLTGNIILNRPILGNSVPSSYNDKASMIYDASGDLFIFVSRDDDAHLNGIYFVNHTVSPIVPPANNKLLMALTQTIITEAGPTIKRYGNITTDIVNSYGLNLSPALTPVGYETCGTATLVPTVGGSVVTVLTKACGPNSKIFLSKTQLFSQGDLIIQTKTQTSFIVKSTSATDQSVFDWMLINPDFTA